MHIPFTYLIGWAKLNIWYYGVRYASNCGPWELWISYFTSSKYVKDFREKNGEPDIIQIRRTFDSAKEAKKWEETVLRRMNLGKDPRFLNKSTNNSFKGSTTILGGPWNKGLRKTNSASLVRSGKNIQKARQEKYWSGPHRKKTSTQKLENRWLQISQYNPGKFISYEDFCQKCLDLHRKQYGHDTIASILEVGAHTVKNALEFKGIISSANPSWSKIKKRLPDFPFQSYEDFCQYCHEGIEQGRLVNHLVKELNVVDTTIKRAIQYFKDHSSKDNDSI